jgi:type I restriction-modification system DNA methylase subunit
MIMAHVNNPTNSEVDAYTYIKEELDKLEWNIKNPARTADGEVYKQNEVLSHIELKKMLKRDMPEAVIVLSPIEFWVIEAKRDIKDIDKALDEAKNQYAEKINKSKKVKCVLISGVAGNETDGYIVRNQYLKNGKWHDVLFNEQYKNILLSKSQALYILHNETFKWTDLPDIPEEKYISSAIEINEILHNAGINKNKRARFLAGLVLSLAQNNRIDLREKDTTTLVENVNSYIKKKLRNVDKENFFDFLRLELPPTQENHIKYRTAIIETIKELSTLDIQNAMASGKDVLGEFYEKFLKYGNGAKEIGIVLTPRHVTEFAVDVLGVTSSDYIFDPTCGTGGFLVAGFDYIKKFSNKEQINNFKDNNIFGIEQDDEVVALALVNMIFRGDGRNNMKEGNCFQNNIEQAINNDALTGEFKKRNGKAPKNPIITKVLMNPPFALKKGDEKERDFIDYALSQMKKEGLLFALIPISVMVEGKTGTAWRKKLLKDNTILSVITLPEELFYPVAVGTVGVFIKKGVPHNIKSQKVYFARAVTDGFRKKKGKRVRDRRETNWLKEIHEELKTFLLNQNIKCENIPEVKKVCTLDIDEVNYEIVPETYIDSKVPTFEEIEEGVEQMVRDNVSYLIKNHKIG